MLALIVDGEYRYTTFENQAAEWPDGSTVIPFDGCKHPSNENWVFHETVHSDIDPTRILIREYVEIIDGRPIVKYEYEPIKYLSLEETLNGYIDWIEKFTIDITGHIPQAERDSWTSKGQAAEAYLNGTASTIQKSMIEVEAAQTGENPIELCNKIVNKLLAYARVAAIIAGVRRKTEMDLKAAEPEKYDSIIADMKSKLMELTKGNSS